MEFNALNHPIVFSSPRRLTPFSAWHEHIPFAMFLVDLLRPSVFVELGTQYGDSHCAFCQGVQELNLGTRCYAIDTWEGDAHTGFYGSEVLEDLRKHHDPIYGNFSSLIKSTFDDALKHFLDGSIDVLHIDGYHTYDVVRHDFESWLPKMSSRGVVLFHDVNVREGDFGVWRFWEELKAQYPHFEFVHGHGLGVLAAGGEQPDNFRRLLEASFEDVIRIRNFFFNMGLRLTLKAEQQAQLTAEQVRFAQQAAQFQATVQSQQQALGERERQIAELTTRLGTLGQEIERFQTSLRQKEKQVIQLKGEQERLTQEAAQLQATVQSQQQALQEKEAQVTRLATQQAQVDQEVTRLRVTVQAQQQGLAQREERITQLVAENEKLANDAAQIQATVQDQQGALQEKEAQVTRLATQQAQLNQEVTRLRVTVQEQQQAIEARDATLSHIYNSHGWKALLVYYMLRDKLLREGTWRRTMAKKVFHAIANVARRLLRLLRGGIKIRWRAATRWLSSRARRQGLSKEVLFLASSGLFQENWYLQENQDVARAGMNPILHYLLHGAQEGRDPNSFFDTSWYLEQNPDVVKAGINPLAHYIMHGAREGRDPHPLFDTSFYAEQNPDVVKAGINPLTHYIMRGAREGRDPHPLFVTLAYNRAECGHNESGVTTKKILRDSSSPQSTVSGGQHNAIQNCRGEPTPYYLARTLLSSGVMNRCWYGGAEVKVSAEQSQHARVYELASPICDEADLKDTNAILEYIGTMESEVPQTYSHAQAGGGPSPDLAALGPVEDIEGYLKKVQPAECHLSTREVSFSIVTPFYRHRDYFTSCAISVLDFVRNVGALAVEWLILNDDPNLTLDELQTMIPRELTPHVKIFSDGQHLGIGRRLNQGISEATHEWVLFLDCDDLISPNAARTLVGYICQFPDCRYISSAMVDIDEVGKVLRYRRRADGPHKLLTQGMIAGHLKAIHRDLFSDYGTFDESLDGCQDYEFALRVAFKEAVLFIPEYLYFYRWHRSSQSVGWSYRQTKMADAIVKKYTIKFVEESVLRTEKDSEPGLREVAPAETNRVIVTTSPRKSCDYHGVAIVRTQGKRLDLLLEALQSLVWQDHLIKAMVVVHGDKSALETVSKSCNGIKLEIELFHAPDTNRLRGYPLNVALRHLYDRGQDCDFLFFLDDDDVVYPMFSIKMFEALTFTDAAVIYAASNRRVPWQASEPGYAPLPAACLIVNNFIPINSYCIRMSSLRAASPFFDESLNYLEDWRFLIELLSLRFRFCAIGDTLSEFRILEDGNVPTKRFPGIWVECADKVRKDIRRVCQGVGRFYLYSQLLSFNFRCRDELKESERELLFATKALIDKECPTIPASKHENVTL